VVGRLPPPCPFGRVNLIGLRSPLTGLRNAGKQPCRARSSRFLGAGTANRGHWFENMARRGSSARYFRNAVGFRWERTECAVFDLFGSNATRFDVPFLMYPPTVGDRTTDVLTLREIFIPWIACGYGLIGPESACGGRTEFQSCGPSHVTRYIRNGLRVRQLPVYNREFAARVSGTWGQSYSSGRRLVPPNPRS
jgi:hypothetical protein